MFFDLVEFAKQMKTLGELPRLMKREPDFVIGDKADPYLRRWHLVPRNEVANIYLHEILKDDDDRALHDHPWDFASIVLRGRYLEHWKIGDEPLHRIYQTGDINFKRAVQLHRIQVLEGPVVTVVFTGPVIREWGFDCPNGWRPWREFVDERDHGKVGRGCG